MPEKKSPLQKSTCLASLKTALLAEQQILGLDSHITRVRTDILLNETAYKNLPASTPSIIPSKEQVLQ